MYVPPEKLDQLNCLIETVKKCNKQYRNIVLTGDLNAKSKLWGNKYENYAGDLLENAY